MNLEQFQGKSTSGLLQSDRGPVAVSRQKSTRSREDPSLRRDDSVDIRIGIILKGAAVRLHARSARRWGSLGSCPKRVGFRHRGPVFFGVVPEKGGFQAPGSGFLWGRARKGWVSGTGVRFSMGSCPKGGCFGHGRGLSSP